MITATLKVTEINESDGYRSTLVNSEVRSLDSFEAESSSFVKIKMTGIAEVQLSNLVDISVITSLFIVSKCDSLNIFPTFNLSIVDAQNAPIHTQRGCQYSFTGADGIPNDIKIDAMDDRSGLNPELLIYITSK